MIKKYISILLMTFVALSAKAQFVDSTMGLLLMPSADMAADGTFMITDNFLNKAYVENPVGNEYCWGYHTFGYGFDITFFSRVEIAYVCTLFNGEWSPYAKSYRALIMKNQDRHFAARFQALREGDLGLSWMPSVVIGISDPVTGAYGGEYTDDKVGAEGNGFFNRSYVAVSKQHKTDWGEVGTHIAYQYSRRKYIIPKGPQFGVTWNPVWFNKPDSFLSSCRLIAEYDAKEVNIGATASIWKDHFEFWACLQACRHFNGGVRFKVVLAGSE